MLNGGTVLYSWCKILAKNHRSGCYWRASIEVPFTVDHGGATVTRLCRSYIICAWVTLNAVSCRKVGEETTYKPQAQNDKETRIQNGNISKKSYASLFFRFLNAWKTGVTAAREFTQIVVTTERYNKGKSNDYCLRLPFATIWEKQTELLSFAINVTEWFNQEETRKHR